MFSFKKHTKTNKLTEFTQLPNRLCQCNQFNFLWNIFNRFVDFAMSRQESQLMKKKQQQQKISDFTFLILINGIQAESVCFIARKVNQRSAHNSFIRFSQIA